MLTFSASMDGRREGFAATKTVFVFPPFWQSTTSQISKMSRVTLRRASSLVFCRLFLKLVMAFDNPRLSQSEMRSSFAATASSSE